jgi:hypothetical protein
MSDIRHEYDNPTTDCYLDSSIEEEEDGAYPGDLICKGEACLRECSSSAWETGILFLIFASGFSPKGASGIN